MIERNIVDHGVGSTFENVTSNGFAMTEQVAERDLLQMILRSYLPKTVRFAQISTVATTDALTCGYFVSHFISKVRPRARIPRPIAQILLHRRNGSINYKQGIYSRRSPGSRCERSHFPRLGITATCWSRISIA
ncbi:hypothetical protein ACLMAL_31425 [Nocardia sp. CWNU-33]|uniref:hypothetical protein n=1 Tax=Nocardia sp. CWNU-33 TaxID=3392117 RepID=UPI00398EEB59